MKLVPITAKAATCEVNDGRQEVDGNGIVHIVGQSFTDIVESEDKRLTGINKPILNITVDPKTGDGSLEGSFVFDPKDIQGNWEGAISGYLEGGMVNANGIARGVGEFEGMVLQLSFQQVAELNGFTSCEKPSAFFKMEGTMLLADK